MKKMANKPVEYYDENTWLGEYVVNPEHVDFDPAPGAKIYFVARACLKTASKYMKPVHLVFNDVKVEIPYKPWPYTEANIEDIEREYFKKCRIRSK